jgi:putative SOS response-associated peptidase YedK
VSEIKIRFAIPPGRPAPNFAASWNVAPTDPLPIAGFNPKDQERGLTVMRWGLVPYCAKDIKVGFANINVKAEGIETKPAFREAFRQWRCLVPVDNFYEWKKTGTGKQPYAIALADRQIMAIAGWSETWRSPAGERIRSFAIVTTTPKELCAVAPPVKRSAPGSTIVTRPAPRKAQNKGALRPADHSGPPPSLRRRLSASMR